MIDAIMSIGENIDPTIDYLMGSLNPAYIYRKRSKSGMSVNIATHPEGYNLPEQ